MLSSALNVLDKFGSFKIFSGNSNHSLVARVCECLGLSGPGDIIVDRFSDGEIRVEIKEDVEGVEIFVIQSICHPVNDNLIELLLIVDALRRSNVRNITAVIPYFGYSRQDGKGSIGVPVSAKLLADMIVLSGVNSVITVDLHAGQIKGFFNIPIYDLSFSSVTFLYIKENFDCGDVVVASPDAGGVGRAIALSDWLGCGMVYINKYRFSPNNSVALSLVGDVLDKIVIIQDDIVDTAGTLVEAVRILNDNGAASVYVFCTHPVLSGKSVDKIKRSTISGLFVSDSIPFCDGSLVIDKIKVLSLDKLISEAIVRTFTNSSVNSLSI